jgi:hypothetical protein
VKHDRCAARWSSRLAGPAGAAVVRRSLRRVLWHAPLIPDRIVESLWRKPDELVASGAMLKDGDRCTVVRLQSGPGEAPMVLKRYNVKGSVHMATHLLLRSRARWCWINARWLIAAGLPTPRPLACVDERRSALLRIGSYLLTEMVQGISLSEMVHSGRAGVEAVRHLAHQFAAIWQTLGQLRVGHGDMKATNFIVDPQGKLWLIDLDGLRVYRSRTLLHRERRNDLARFMQNWQGRPEVSAIFRARIGTG